MANEFFTILTATGRNKLAAATATGTALTLTQMAVGDGDNGAYYSPTEAQTALKHEVWRGAINHLAVDANNPNWIVAELVIPDNVGGFYIREVGLFDSTGAMIAVGKFPESYKPTLAAGSNKQLYVRMILEVANTSAVTLLVDPSVVLATRQYCDDKVASEINKLDGKQSVRVATTAAIALSGLLTIDGVLLAAGDRVLVKDQATTKDNGIYVVAAGNWTRAADADAAIEVTPGLFVSVEQGAANADSIWQLVTDAPITLGTTGLTFEMAAGKTGVAAGTYDGVTVNARGQVVGGTNTTTPPQFDNSTKKATTEFVKRTGLQASGFTVYTAAATIPASAYGSVIQAGNGAGAYALTLPLTSACPDGTRLEFVCTSNSPVTIQAQGAEAIGLGGITLNINDTLELQSNGHGSWFVVGGSILADKTRPGFNAKGKQRFVANGSFTVPLGVTTIWVSGCGGGGGGGGSGGVNCSGGGWAATGGGGGGGAGQYAIRQAFSVTPGQVLTVAVGGAGSGGSGGAVAGNGGTGTSGGATTLTGAGVALTLAGGTGGVGSAGVNGVAVASPGGAGGSQGGTSGGYALAIGGYGYDHGGLGGVGGAGPFGTPGPSGGGAFGYGCGGGGVQGVLTASTATGFVGGVGSPGFLEIEW